MDVTPFLDPMPAPFAVFEGLEARRDRVRFQVPAAGGGFAPVTWGAFADRVRDLALFLSSDLVGPGERAAVYAPNRLEWAEAALAIQTAGGVMVPIYPGTTATGTAYVVRHSDARVVFVDTKALFARVLEAWDAFAEVRRVVILDPEASPRRWHEALAAEGRPVPPWEAVAERLVSWEDALAEGAARAAAEPGALPGLLGALDLDRPGLMLYTSGTSGDPKGVPLTHRNVGVNGADWLVNFAPLLEPKMRDLLWLPMSHIFGWGELCLGNTLEFTTWLTDPARVLDLMPEVKPSVFMSVPAYWEKLAMAAKAAGEDPEARRARLAEATGGRLQVCLSGGAGLKREVKALFHDAGLLIVEGYGLTEASPTLTLNRPDDFRFDSVGKPLASVELRLAEDGEILARGPSVFAGYHKDPQATAEVFTEDGWLKTGDVGRLTEDGFLQIVDRKKDILVTAGGKNVPPANVELRFRDDPFVEQVVVYGDGKKYLVAGVWPNRPAVEAFAEARGEDPAEVLARVLQESVERANAELPRHESIRRFAVMDTPLTVENGLLTPSLKVRRKKVYEAFGALFEGLYDEGGKDAR